MPKIERLSTKRRQRPARRELTDDQKRKAKFYNNKQWKALRQTYYQNHPLDEVQKICGRIRLAEHVHHLIKFDDQADDRIKMMLLTDPDNLVSVTTYTHTLIHTTPELLHEQQRIFLEEKRQNVIAKYKNEFGIDLIVNDHV